VLFGVIQGGIVIGIAPFVANFFAPDVAVAESLLTALVVIGMHQPLAALVFLLDGVLLGWGDNAFMAKAQTLAMFGFIPAGYVIWQLDLGLVAIWGSVIWWLAIRAGLLWWRNRKLIQAKTQFAS
jgi:Na+-driven multidrug efflux pump